VFNEKFRNREGDINISAARKRWAEANADSAASDLLDRDSRVFLHQALSTPCLDALTGCEGAHITNAAGKKYLDFHGNNVHQVGFGNPYVVEAVKKQLDKLPFCTRRFTNELSIALAEKLTLLTNGYLSRVLFAPSGTCAVGTALKLARVVTGKYKTISMWDSFHGASMDAISVGGESAFRSDIGPLLPGCEHVIPFNSYRCMYGDCGDCGYYCVSHIEYILRREPDVGAIILETVRNTDVQIPTKKYLQSIRRLCDKYHVLMILDETAICMGRTGKWFAYEHFGIVPDMVVLGKGLGGGVIPHAALLCKEEFNVASHISLGHYTFEKNPVAAAASLAVIDYIESRNILKETERKGEMLRRRLNQIKDRNRHVGDLRGIGLLSGVELVLNRESKEPDNKLAEELMYACLTDGLSFKVSCGNVLSLSPALIIEECDLMRAAKIIEDNLERMTHEKRIG